VISQGAPTEYVSREEKVWGFIQRRVVISGRSVEFRIERPMVTTSLRVEYIPPTLFGSPLASDDVRM